jgi:hypothetical protein
MSDDAKLFGDTSADSALFGDEPPREKIPTATDKKTGLPLVSPSLAARSLKSDAELGIPATKTKVRIQDVGPARFAREVFNPSELDETQQNYLSKNPNVDLIANDPAAIQPGVNGVRAATTLAKAGLSEAARLAGKTSLSDRVAAAMSKLLEGTHKGIIARGAELLAPEAAGIAEKAAGAVVPAVKAAAKAVAPAAAPVGRSVLSNAVDRLRASAEISPSAMDFTRRLDAAAAMPNGTVTQGTLGGTP